MPESRPLNISEYACRAKNNIAGMAWDYYSGGSDDEITLAENEAAWRRARLHYRILVDIAVRSTRTNVLGHELSMPVMAAPTAFQKLAHADGELATVRATTMAGTAMVLSSLSTVDVEDVMDAAQGPVFFQLYMYKDRNVSRDLIRRVESAGCKAIILTVDAPLLGNRERDERNHFALPEGVTVRNLTATGHLDFSADGGSGLSKFV
ncbi:MAG: alpha-hydroxy acid oxidase, partial [Phycisphaerales bacterium]|nr:alpha-hydroxy acid oxidase [Phycisphaerales bacterium]